MAWPAGPTLFEDTSTTMGNRQSQLPNLKDMYDEVIEEWMASPENIEINRWGRKIGSMAGRRVLYFVMTRRAKGSGFIGENLRLPFPFPSTGANPYVLTKWQAMRNRNTLQGLSASMKKGAAFQEMEANELASLEDQYTVQRSDNLIRGRVNILGQIASYSAGGNNGTGTLTLYGRNARRATSSASYRQGLTNDFHPIGENDVIETIDSASGAEGAPVITALGSTAASAAAGPPLRISSTSKSDEEAPTVVVQAVDPTTGEDITPSSTITTAYSFSAGDYIITLNSRRRNQTYSGNGATNDALFHSMNGMADFAWTTDHHSHLYGLALTSYVGLQAQWLRGNPAGTQRAWQERLVGLGLRRSIAQSNRQNSPTRLYGNYSIADLWFQENANLRQFQPVIGDSGWQDLQIVMFGKSIGMDFSWQALEGLAHGYNSKMRGLLEERGFSSPDPIAKRYIDSFLNYETIKCQAGNTIDKRPFHSFTVDDLPYNAYDL